MPSFRYVAKDQDGTNINSTVESADKKSAIDYLRKKNLIILSIEEASAQSIFSALAFFSGARKRVKLDDIVIFSRQLATMVDAGIPLVSAFDILGEQSEKNAFKKILLSIRDNIQTGSSLSESLAKHPNIFSSLFVNMVKAGESSGMLDEILERVASYLEKTSALIRKVKSALIYPAIITIMAVVITAVLLLKVIPVFEEIFKGFGAQLPYPTRVLIGVSNIFRHYFLLLAFTMSLCGFLLVMYVRTEKGRLMFDGIMLRLPVFGPLMTKVAISKFTRTLSTLTKSGVPILSALEIVGKTSGNKVVERAVEDVHKNIREGEKIAGPLARSKVFPPMVVRMISVGEETGELEKMLTKISDFYDEQVDAAVTGLTSMIEPLIICFLGIVIGTIVICMFMPIFKVSTLVNM
ncbi:MAG: pilus assembly protein PilC [Candidatus Omnitrophica bacterium CG07_land_8_20_14_0_80_42_15]|uniref:General secretion pathway protein F n=1 Tax=Candidatus Aquitaenariimonas noxiae TaxID=1974741 RepID=A0A2J0KST7_9BACT|nr:MAG: pilus assembly protein PilC [Candidatus Omnitrophica bacterium CG07_land_8_20_14_0_80_42_15]